MRKALILTAIAAFLAVPALPCTAFLITTEGAAYAAKNYDWDTGVGMLVVNKRGVAKAAFGVDAPAAWTSRYGSVTFNQYGREFPVGGVNEAGLAIEALWLDETEYPPADGRAALNCLQWVQYMLDTCGAVDDVRAAAEDVRVAADSPARLHYFVADAGGDCAAVEFLRGDFSWTSRELMPMKALANDAYDDALGYLTTSTVHGDTWEDFKGTRSLDRFARAALAAHDFNPAFLDSAGPESYAFGVLDNVAYPEYTQWRIVYDLAAGRVYFRSRANERVRYIDLDALDFSAATPVKVIDLGGAGEGDAAAALADYSADKNRALIDEAFAATPFLQDVGKEARDALAAYPETTRPAAP